MKLSLVLVAVFLPAAIICHGTGAPDAACTSMEPNHTDKLDTKNSKDFELVASKNAQGSFDVTLRGLNQNTFKGYLVKAVKSGSTKAQGHFSSFEHGTLDCPGKKTKNALTHSSRYPEKSSTSFVWVPPSPGSYMLKATVVKELTKVHYISKVVHV